MPDIHELDIREQVAAAVVTMRQRKPLVQCLTNIVVANFTANVLLAAGAVPAMVDNPEESGLFTGAADGVLVNTGTPYPDTARAMVAAAGAAGANGTCWVLDPVAAGLPWRTSIAKDCLSAGRPTIIRANASEVLALSGAGAAGRGPDASDPVEAALPAARALQREHGCVVAVSGAVDHLIDADRHVTISSGHEWMTLVTGVGCSLGALMAAFGGCVEDPLVAAAAATAMLCVAAERAAGAAAGPGAFASGLLDQLYLVEADEVAQQGGIDDVQA